MSEKHTPTPWRVGGTPSNKIWGDGEVICEVWPHGEAGQADAVFIVHAVNNHQALVEALRVFSDEAEVECNRVANGTCSTRSCLIRGGWKQGQVPVNYDLATCKHFVARTVLAKATE